jgi:site-specific DNA-methyltransferase (adenine-specific)
MMETMVEPISEVFLMDCVEGMKQYPDNYFDLAVVDPPYGINAPNMTMGSNPNRNGRHKNGENQYGGVSVAEKLKKGRLNQGGEKLKNRMLNTSAFDWDNEVPTDEYWEQLFRVSVNQVVWGGNYFPLPPTRGIACWNKNQPWDNFSQFELAWTSFDCPARLITLSNRGGNNEETKIHPTQKPVKLYDWIYKHYLPQGGKVLDTHLGSQSNRISAFKTGNIDFTAFEIDKEYFEKGEKRFQQFKSQLRLF